MSSTRRGTGSDGAHGDRHPLGVEPARRGQQWIVRAPRDLKKPRSSLGPVRRAGLRPNAVAESLDGDPGAARRDPPEPIAADAARRRHHSGHPARKRAGRLRVPARRAAVGPMDPRADIRIEAAAVTTMVTPRTRGRSRPRRRSPRPPKPTPPPGPDLSPRPARRRTPPGPLPPPPGPATDPPPPPGRSDSVPRACHGRVRTVLGARLLGTVGAVPALGGPRASMFGALAAARGRANTRAVTAGIEAMEHEEAYFARYSVAPSASRARARGLRALLTGPPRC